MNVEPWHWFVIGVLLIIAEMFTMTFAALWFGMAAVIVACLSWLIPPLANSLIAQMLVWLILSVFSVIAWFKFIQPAWSRQRTKAGLGAGVIVGEIGMLIVKPIQGRAGKIRFSVPKFGSTEWMCRSEDDTIEVGDRVVVTNILGNELVVKLAYS